MCKFNILCKSPDGQCKCSLSINTGKAQNVISDLLGSILEFIKSQPEIMNSITKNSNEPQNSPYSGLTLVDTNKSLDPASPIQASDHSIILLSDLPSKITLGRSFHLLVETIDKNLIKSILDAPTTFQVCLIGKTHGEEIILGELETTGTGLFKKLIINQKVENPVLVIRAKNRPDLLEFSQKISLKIRKKYSDMPEKKVYQEVALV